MKLVLGADSSTQSVKVEARVAETGDLIATGRASHPPTTPPVSEQDPQAWWDAFADAVGQLGDARKDIAAVSIAGQQHGLVLLDENDQPLRPAKLWNDTTSAPNADRLVEARGAQWWTDKTGSVPVAAFTITKLAWVAENEPELLDRIAKVMLPHDYLTYRLSGRHVTDRGDASGSGWFDALGSGTVSDALSDALGSGDWDAKVPAVLGPTEVVGTIDPEVADALGLAHDVVIGPGTGDNMGAALGLGLGEGDMVISLGTSGTVYARSAQRTSDPSGAVAGFSDATGQFLPLVCTLNATKVTDTVARLLGTDASGLADLAMQAGTDVIEPTVVPYFDGERTPNRPDARGLVVGLTTDVSREEIARAAHDGVLCGLLEGAQALVDAGASDDGRLFLVGGGAQSAAYRQRLATLAEKTVFVPKVDETVAVGAALQAAAVANSADLDDLAGAWGVDASDATEPEAPETGAEIRARYRDAAAFDDGLCRPRTD